MYTDNKVKPLLNPLWAIMCNTIDITKQERQLLRVDSELRKSKDSLAKYTACKGGTLYEIVRYYYRAGAVVDSCVSIESLQSHIDQNGELPLCSDVSGTTRNRCSDPRKAVRRWPILDFYIVSRSNNLLTIANYMKYDICSRGPLVAGFNMFPDFLDEYDGKSIYKPKKNQSSLGGHAIKIVGWGRDGDQDYWICANSWGIEWGENGYYRMAMADELLETELNHLSIVPQVPGILKHFKLSRSASAAREVDTELRNATNINPFTFYDKRTTNMIKEGELDGSLRSIFSQLDYELNPNVFQMNRQEPSIWNDPTGKIVTVTLIIGAVCGLLLIFLRLFVFNKKKT